MKINHNLLEKKINIEFKDKNKLVKSLTHKSFNSKENNEKLEFLGDRVLGLVISKKLLELYPKEKEGVLDKKFASLVNKNTCLQIAKKINLDKFILTLNSEKAKTPPQDKVISDSCEALIGAIYLDRGFNVVEKFILDLWKEEISQSKVTLIDAKTQLQEFSLKKYKKLPEYKMISNTGPRHKPIIKVSVKIHNSKNFIAEGSSKKIAEQNAAIKCLNSLDL
jgi:ribonuclease-3